MPLITAAEAAEHISPIFGGKMGKLLFNILLRVTGIHKVNAIHDRVEAAGIPYGPEFAKGILDDIGVDFLIGGAERLASLPEGPFIVVSNHVYGHVDGICLVDLIGHVRPETKVMVNQMLMWIKGLAPCFIPVNPNTDDVKNVSATSINGMKSALRQIRDGGPLCLFPSGAVADLEPREHWKLKEREWQDVAVRLIKKAKVPVIPVRFFDRNSWFYYALELIHYKVRFLRLFHELDRLRGTFPRVGVGEPITLEEQNRFDDLKEYGDFLRSKVDMMPVPETFVKRSELWK